MVERARNTYQNDLQKLIDREARAITAMFQSYPMCPLMSEAGLLPADILLDFDNANTHFLSNSISTKYMLPITLRAGDGNMQLEDQPEYDSVWATTQRIKTSGQYLARQVSVGFSIDPAEGTGPFK